MLMIDNTALLRARVKMVNTKRQNDLLAANREGKRHTPPRQSTACRAYGEQAREILRDISELRDLVLSKRQEYILCSGSLATYSFTTIMSEADRRRFENDSDTAIKQCQKLVQCFETRIQSDRALRLDDELVHLRFVAHLLAGYLRRVCALIQQLRSIYRRKTERMRKICRLANLVEKYERTIDDAHRAERELVAQATRHRAENVSPPPLSPSRGVGAETKCAVGGTTSASSDDAANRRALNLACVGETRRVRVYDFTSGASRTRLKDENDAGKAEGWSELEDSVAELNAGDKKSLAVDSKKVRNPLEKDQNECGEQAQDVRDETAALRGVSGRAPKSNAKKKSKKIGGLSISKATPTAAERLQRVMSVGAQSLSPPPASVSAQDEFVDASPPSTIELSRVEEEQLVAENRKLFEKFAHSDEDILHIGRQLTEIQRLQDTFAEKVTQQEHDIDHIHTQTVYTLDNLEAANQFIRNAIKDSASRRVIALFCLIVLTFTLLFLDWYNP